MATSSARARGIGPVADTIRKAKAVAVAVGTYSLPQVAYSGDTWSSVLTAVWEASRQVHPMGELPDGTIVPRLTNRDAAALVQAWRSVAPMGTRGWPLWYQFAAVTFGWNATADTLNVTTQQAGELFPLAMTADLWSALMGIANDLDNTPRAAAVKPASVELDPDMFFDMTFQGEVRQALIDDGAAARVKGAGTQPPATATTTKVQRPAAKSSTSPLVPLLLIGGALYVFGRKGRRKPTRRRALAGIRRRRK